jgi:DNA polymerase I-like protein with 3'-5' exonuclease and polymerase domains
VAQIHDELLFECEEGYVAEAARVVRRCMEAAVPGLAVPTPAKVMVGRSWADLRLLEG